MYFKLVLPKIYEVLIVPLSYSFRFRIHLMRKVNRESKKIQIGDL